MIWNKIKTPQSLFLAKECSKIWLQKVVTCNEGPKMVKNSVCVPL